MPNVLENDGSIEGPTLANSAEITRPADIQSFRQLTNRSTEGRLNHVHRNIANISEKVDASH